MPVLNVYENIVLPVELDGRKADSEFISGITETLGISDKLANLPGQLSGGQQQRVAIARALATKPAILLCDEPTGNLDSRTSQDVLGLLRITSRQYAQTIVMITHNEEIAQLADRIIRIEDGRISNGRHENGRTEVFGGTAADAGAESSAGRVGVANASAESGVGRVGENRGRSTAGRQGE